MSNGYPQIGSNEVSPQSCALVAVVSGPIVYTLVELNPNSAHKSAVN